MEAAVTLAMVETTEGCLAAKWAALTAAQVVALMVLMMRQTAALIADATAMVQLVEARG